MNKIVIDREVLEQVLAALKKCDSELSEELTAWEIDPQLYHVMEASNACSNAIEILNAALAQPLKDKDLLCTSPARKPLTAEERDFVFYLAEKKMQTNPNLSWRNAIIDEVEAAHESR